LANPFPDYQQVSRKKYRASSDCSWNTPLVVLLVLGGDTYVNIHPTLFRRLAGDRREGKELL
jgi:hypothetical protein